MWRLGVLYLDALPSHQITLGKAIHMEVTLIPNQRRPGIGRRPAPENRRAWLPQQARFCPVIEDASRTGFLVYPPLQDQEIFQVRRLREDHLRFTLALTGDDSTTRPLWTLELTMAAGSGGLDSYDVRFVADELDLNQEQVIAQLEALTTNLNGPPGAVGLRGAYDFATPEGWDTFYMGVTNELAPPHVPVMTARIETDWYSQATEFRHVLAVGQTLSVAGTSPIGQVIFIPRDDVMLIDSTEVDATRFTESQQQYWHERAGKEKATNFGTLYTYHYRDLQKEHRETEASD
jgi:hypothetical protein